MSGLLEVNTGPETMVVGDGWDLTLARTAKLCTTPPSLSLDLINMCLPVGMCTCECRYQKRPEEGIVSSGVRVTNDCKLPDVGTGNQTLNHCLVL